MKKYLFLAIVLLTASAAWSKNPVMDTLTTPAYYRYVTHSQRYFSILTGYNFGKEDFAELGISLNTKRRKRSNTGGTAWFLSDELKVRNKFIMGPKIGVWTGNGLAAGMSLIYYTDLESQSCLRLRPEIGVGDHSWKLTYGYNIPLNNSSFAGIDKHVVSLSILWKAAKLGEHTVARDWDPGGRKKYANRQLKDSTRSTDHGVLVAGVNGWTNAFGEIGFGLYSEESEKKKNRYSYMAYVSAEVKLSAGTIIAPKVGLFMAGGKKFGIGGGASMIYYTGMGHGSLAVRPEVGLHYSSFRLTYGYNHILTNSAYYAVAQHNVSAVMGVKLGRGKTTVKVKKEDRSF
jgi:hypothetical protein